jgi:hypothetical protein
MACNEAPVPQTRGLPEKALGGASIGPAETADLCFIQPDQLRCCESPLDESQRASACWLHCSIQVACHNDSSVEISLFQQVAERNEVPFAWAFYES